jgi:D-alanyl-D-alanine carboxypeptidase/D-alanyl-D-alanine-endopeptidase (penicillin-binding protein 4)
MKKVCLGVLVLILFHYSYAQSVEQRLAKAFSTFLADPHMKYATAGLYVIDLKTGKTVFGHNIYTGLAPASTQKLFTSAAVFDILGSAFRFRTDFSYTGNIVNGVLRGDLIIKGYGDPTTGSWRWNETKAESMVQKIADSLKAKGIHKIEGRIIADNSQYSLQPVPDGWIWQDIGNYYGAGCWALNWHENQYDLRLRSGIKEGEKTAIVSAEPVLAGIQIKNQVLSGKKGSGDNAYIYLPPYSVNGFALGTIPPGETGFVISGSFPEGPRIFLDQLKNGLQNQGFIGQAKDSILYSTAALPAEQHLIFTMQSPSADSINYWFLKKSVNLFGEAFAKALAFNSNGIGDTDKGVSIIKEYWKKNGIAAGELNMMDGSGLSPQNRVTAHALVQVLKHAQTRSWYPSFYAALPEYNGMRMKSGSIGGARAYAGYHRSKSGAEYAFAIMVNNYEGSAGSTVSRMYAVLDELK